VRIYRHQLTTGKTFFLRALYDLAGTDPVHVPSANGVMGRRGSEGIGILACWDLTEKSSGVREGKDSPTVAGWWKVTEAGEAFLDGDLTVEEFVLVAPYFKVHSNEAETLVYVPDIVSYSGELVDIHSVAEGRFDPDTYIQKWED